MAVGTTKTFPKELDKSIDNIFFQEYNEAPTEFDKIAKIVPSYEGGNIKESELSGIGAMRTKGEGDRIQYDYLIEGNEVNRTAATYALGFQVTQEMIEDDYHKNILAASGELGKSAAYKRETVFWDLFNNGFATHTAWDSNYIWISSGRTTLKSGDAMNNRPSTDAALSETTLQAAFEYFQTVKNSSGRPVPMKLNMLIIPITLQWTGWNLKNVDGKPGSMDNDLNTLKSQGDWGIHVSQHLTDSDNWFAISGDHDFRYAWKRNITLENSDDFETKNRLYSATMRFMCFCNNPLGTYGVAP
jgi:hypothetical protein